jgi:hypothetical protein
VIFLQATTKMSRNTVGARALPASRGWAQGDGHSEDDEFHIGEVAAPRAAATMSVAAVNAPPPAKKTSAAPQQRAIPPIAAVVVTANDDDELPLEDDEQHAVLLHAAVGEVEDIARSSDENESSDSSEEEMVYTKQAAPSSRAVEAEALSKEHRHAASLVEQQRRVKVVKAASDLPDDTDRADSADDRAEWELRHAARKAAFDAAWDARTR